MISVETLAGTFGGLSDIKEFGGALSGQKEVFLARMGRRRVVLKIVKEYETDRERTQREIDAVSKLKSKFVPKVFDFGSKNISGRKRLYIIEQYVEGKTYRQVLAERARQDLRAVLSLAKDLVGACIDFEKAHLVHRDIKPENIIIGTDSKTWIIDFGLARHLDMTSITPTSQAFGVGTLTYASPEQFRNLKPEIDIRADLYSIGIVLYEALSGSNPFLERSRNPLEIIKFMENEDLPKLHIPSDHDDKFSDFIASMTARFPSRRPRTSIDAMDWLASIIGP